MHKELITLKDTMKLYIVIKQMKYVCMINMIDYVIIEIHRKIQYQL